MEIIRLTSPVRRWVRYESPARKDFGEVSRLRQRTTERSAVQRTVAAKSTIYAKELS